MTGTFTIEAGKHTCRPRWPYLFYGSAMSRIVRFDPTCIYKGLPDGREPVNKLFGFAELWPGIRSKFESWTVYGAKEAGTAKALHHEASARFGWNCDNTGQLWIYGYSYAEGVRETKKICPAFPSRNLKCTIQLEAGYYCFRVHQPNNSAGNNLSRHGYSDLVLTARGTKAEKAFGYGLNFYFGGSGPSPHKMSINLSRVK